MPPTPPTTTPRTLSPVDTRAATEQGDAVLVDVREDGERAAAFIPGSYAAPLSSLDPASLFQTHAAARIIFQCKSGIRSADAAVRFAQATGAPEAWSLAGGIEAWRRAGLPIERAAHAPPLDVMRQVQIAAGGLVVVSILGSLLLHPAFIGLAAFVGTGLVFAGVSGWCGMAKLLNRMPWNAMPHTPPQAT